MPTLSSNGTVIVIIIRGHFNLTKYKIRKKYYGQGIIFFSKKIIGVIAM